jgi:hypothetical protein
MMERGWEKVVLNTTERDLKLDFTNPISFEFTNEF